MTATTTPTAITALHANPCVSCCERVATTTSEGVEHPVCEPCAAEEARAIADYNQTSPRGE